MNRIARISIAGAAAALLVAVPGLASAETTGEITSTATGGNGAAGGTGGAGYWNGCFFRG